MSTDLKKLSNKELVQEAKKIGRTASVNIRGGEMACAAALTELSALVEELFRRIDEDG